LLVFCSPNCNVFCMQLITLHLKFQDKSQSKKDERKEKEKKGIKRKKGKNRKKLKRQNSLHMIVKGLKLQFMS
jgi:hypothetical protein